MAGGPGSPAGGRQQITHCEAAAETPPGCGHPVIVGVSCGDRGSVIKVNNYWESIPTEEESEPTGHYPANPTLSLPKLHTEKLLPDLGWPVILITDCLPTADSAAARLVRSFLGQQWQKLQMKKIKPLHGGSSEPSGLPDCGH